jgi:hypothetical protein
MITLTLTAEETAEVREGLRLRRVQLEEATKLPYRGQLILLADLRESLARVSHLERSIDYLEAHAQAGQSR